MSTSNPTLHVTIDGQRHAITDDDQQASSLLRRAGRDPKKYDLFLIDKHGIEVHVRDGQIVHLKDGEQFATRQKLHFSIDGEEHTTFDDDQELSDLLRLAGVDPNEYDLARLLRAGGSETIAAGTTVKIADGDEFVTAKHVGGVA